MGVRKITSQTTVNGGGNDHRKQGKSTVENGPNAGTHPKEYRKHQHQAPNAIFTPQRLPFYTAMDFRSFSVFAAFFTYTRCLPLLFKHLPPLHFKKPYIYILVLRTHTHTHTHIQSPAQIQISLLLSFSSALFFPFSAGQPIHPPPTAILHNSTTFTNSPVSRILTNSTSFPPPRPPFQPLSLLTKLFLS